MIFISYTLGEVNLGTVSRENHKQISDIDTNAYVFGATRDMVAIDMGNVLRKITIEGTYVDTTKANIMNNFVVLIDNFQNGDQGIVVFHSDLWDLSTAGVYQDGNFNIKVESFDWDYEHGKECAIRYTIVLIESLAGG